MKRQRDELRSFTAHAENRRTETGISRGGRVQGAVLEHERAAVYGPMFKGSKSFRPLPGWKLPDGDVVALSHQRDGYPE